MPVMVKYCPLPIWMHHIARAFLSSPEVNGGALTCISLAKCSAPHKSKFPKWVGKSSPRGLSLSLSPSEWGSVRSSSHGDWLCGLDLSHAHGPHIMIFIVLSFKMANVDSGVASERDCPSGALRCSSGEWFTFHTVHSETQSPSMAAIGLLSVMTELWEGH